jgi:hypothetical protein
VPGEYSKVKKSKEMPRAGLRSSGKAASGAAEMRAHLKRLLAEEEVVLSAELAELLRHRELTWSLIPPVARAGAAVPDAEGDFETGHCCDRERRRKEPKRSRPLGEGVQGSAQCWL